MDYAVQAAKQAAYVQYFGIRNDAAAILTLLEAAKGKPVALMDFIRPGVVETEGHLRWAVCLLRRALNVEAVDTIKGGYALTEVGQAECRKAREVMMEALVA